MKDVEKFFDAEMCTALIQCHIETVKCEDRRTELLYKAIGSMNAQVGIRSQENAFFCRLQNQKGENWVGRPLFLWPATVHCTWVDVFACDIWRTGRRSRRISCNVIWLTADDELPVSAKPKVKTKFYYNTFGVVSHENSTPNSNHEMDTFVEPGAVRHGNFINYYDFNSASERLNLLPTDPECWSVYRTADENSPYLVLDVGCNAGNFTQMLYEFLRERVKKKIIVLGIDIDPILIKRANGSNVYADNVLYSCCDIMNDGSNCIESHLAKHDVKRFDVASCMSITMWIHLNNGDEGLLRFLDTVNRLSVTLVIEPQPWKCYQNAVRRMKRAREGNTFPLYGSLKMRNDIENDIKNHLQVKCMAKFCFESDATAWKRKICLYRNSTVE